MLSTSKIPLRNRKKQVVAEVIVDPEDFERLNAFRWYLHGKKYAARGSYDPETKRTKVVFMHHDILPKMNGLDVDHINRDRFDNRKENLRLVTRTINNRNRTTNLNSTSGHKGVFWDGKRKKWLVQIDPGYGSKTKSLGRYENLEQAIYVRLKAEKDLWGDQQ
jgi:hypothetical protein